MTNTTIPAGKLRHILIWGVVILYLLISPSVYYHLFPREGKPVELWEQQPEEKGKLEALGDPSRA